jgi:hypothetical protein
MTRVGKRNRWSLQHAESNAEANALVRVVAVAVHTQDDQRRPETGTAASIGPPTIASRQRNDEGGDNINKAIGG